MSVSATSTYSPEASTKARMKADHPESLPRDKILAQFLEALVVVFFACACGVIIFGYGPTITLSLVALFLSATVVTFVAALKLSYRVAKSASAEAERTRYEITSLRITVLKEAKVANDVTQCLADFLDSSESDSHRSMTREDLLGVLRRGLGDERTKEVEATVLKYTRLHVEDSESL